MQTLEQFLGNAVADMWKINPLGKIVVRKPNVIQNSEGISVTTTIDYGRLQYRDGANGYEDRSQVPTPPAKIWQPSLASYGLFIETDNGALKASLALKSFPEDAAADILNSKTPVISAQDIRRRIGTNVTTRDIFLIGGKLGLSDNEVILRIKEHYTPKKFTGS